MPRLAPEIQSPAVIEKAFKGTNPKTGKPWATLTDGYRRLGLYVEFKRTPGATVNSGHPWRLDYVQPSGENAGRKNKLFFGLYPTVGIADARQKAVEARALLAKGIDPGVLRNEAAEAMKATAELARENDRRQDDGEARLGSFRFWAEKYVEVIRGERMPSYVNEAETALKAFAYPAFGDKPVQAITLDDITAWDAAMELRGKVQMHKKARRFVWQVLDWCTQPEQRASGVKGNPVFLSRKLRQPTVSTPRPSVVAVPGKRITLDEMTGRVRTLVHAIHNWRPQTLEWQTRGQGTRHAMLLTLWTAQRIGTIVSAEKHEFYLDDGVWIIPAAKMKGRRERKANALDHVVYLPRQCVAMLREQFASAPDSKWVFPGQRNSRSGHMNRSTTGTRMKEIGLGDEHAHSSHGFRALLRTAGQLAAGIKGEKLEAILAHRAANAAVLDGNMRGVYLRDHLIANYDDSLQIWADWLDSIAEEPTMHLVDQPEPQQEEALQAA